MSQSSLVSSSSTYPPKYDVFLNFRGADTRYGFTRNLYEALSRRGIRTFFDDGGFETGDVINPTLIQAIRNSSMAITVFSPRYLESDSCLMELAEISNNMSDGFILPVFFDIEPSNLRQQSKAVEMKQEWSLAVDEVSQIKGTSTFRSDGKVYEADFITQIVDHVSKKLDLPSNIVDYRVGLKPRVAEVCLLLNSNSDDDINMVGICGIDGIGKTALARAVYNTLAPRYKNLCFFSNVREKSLRVDSPAELQQELLSKIFGENSKKHPHEILESRLRTQKVLLVVDDVNNLQQLKALALREWFCPGSKIIITTTNKKLLESHGVESIYEVKELNEDEACELLSLHAFQKYQVDSEYKAVLKQAVDCAKGHPLVLEALGSILHGSTLREWEFTLEMYAKNLSRLQWSDKNIQRILRVSYDGLTEVEKEIFLDIACFYKGQRLENVKKRVYNSHGFNPEYYIRALIDKFLIKIDQDGYLKMHDLYEDMGKELVRQQSKSKPGQCSRLYSSEDIIEVLKNETGTSDVQVIKLFNYGEKKIEWSGKAIGKMDKLRELCISLPSGSFSTAPKCLPNSLRVLEWHQYPSSALPSDFDPSNLVILNLHNSHLKLKKPLQRFSNLCELTLDNNKFLTLVPDVSGAPILRILTLNYCYNLVKIHDSVGYLPQLCELRARACHRLKILPRVLKLPSLEILDLMDCWRLKYFPEISVTMKKIKTVCLSNSGIIKLPESIENLIGLEWLYLNGCKKLWQTQIARIAKPNIRVLDLRCTKVTFLPASFKECQCLERLYVDKCDQLQEIKGIPPNLKRFSAVNCTSLNPQSSKLLLSKNIHEARNTQFILPGKQIPEWFQHKTSNHSLSFWFHEKFPGIALCVVFHITVEYIFLLDFQVVVNGTHVKKFRSLELAKDHVYLVDLTSRIQKLELQMECSEFEWNHVEVSCSGFSKSSLQVLTGVYVYNYESGKEFVRFEDPNHSKRKKIDVKWDASATASDNADDIPINNGTDESKGEPHVSRINEKELKLMKERRLEQNINLLSVSSSIVPECMNRIENEQDSTPNNPICITDSKQKQRHLTSVNHQISKSHENVRKAKGIEMDYQLTCQSDKSHSNENVTWDPMKLEHQVSGRKEQLGPVDQSNNIKDKGDDAVWDPMELEYQVLGRKEQLVPTDQSNKIRDKGDDIVV